MIERKLFRKTIEFYEEYETIGISPDTSLLGNFARVTVMTKSGESYPNCLYDIDRDRWLFNGVEIDKFAIDKWCYQAVFDEVEREAM